MLSGTGGGTYLPGQGEPGPWLRAVVRDGAIDAVRRNEARRRRDRRSAPDGQEGRTSCSAVHDAVWTAACTQQLGTALGSLVPAQCEVLLLAYGHGLTQVEIAEQLAVPLATVKPRTRAGLRVLRTALALSGPAHQPDPAGAPGRPRPRRGSTP